MEGYTSKPLLLGTEVNTLGEIFEHAEEWTVHLGSHRFVTSSGVVAAIVDRKYVGPYCVVDGHPSGHQSLWVKPTARVCEVARTMMGIHDGGLYFKCTIRDDGSCIVSVQYEQIIGSRWLAMIPASELDRFGWKRDDESEVTS